MALLYYVACFLLLASFAELLLAHPELLDPLIKSPEINDTNIGLNTTCAHNVTDEPQGRTIWFQQKLDHFSPTSTQTWLQRYSVKRQYYGDNGLIFLYIKYEDFDPSGGYGAINEYAKKYRAKQFSIEHRFYGESRPRPDLTLGSLKYLSIDQALADLAYFITSMNAKMGCPNPKWIVFGGSYTGAVAAWLRYKYPHLVYAAVASSPLLSPRVDFPEYLQSATKSLAAHSPQCVESIRAAHRELIDGLSNVTKREQYRRSFQLCDPLDNNEKDVGAFFEKLADNFRAAVQYNEILTIGMDAVCSIMTSEKIQDPAERYAKVNSMWLSYNGKHCFRHKYSDWVNSWSNTSFNSPESFVGRQYWYQSCTELGFFPSSSNNNGTFGDKFPVKFYIDLCTDSFGPEINESLIYRSVEATKMKYGALSMEVSRVLFVEGAVDPYTAVGMTSTPSAGSYAIIISGAAHCRDMQSSYMDDSESLFKARAKIIEIIGSWVSGKRESGDVFRF